MRSSIFYKNLRQKRRCRKLRTNYDGVPAITAGGEIEPSYCRAASYSGLMGRRSVNYNALVKL